MQPYYGILSVAFLFMCICCWMLGSWMRAFSVITVAGSSYAGYMATLPGYGQKEAWIVAGILAFACLFFTFLATTSRQNTAVCHECVNCGRTLPRQLGDNPTCPDCGDHLRLVTI